MEILRKEHISKWLVLTVPRFLTPIRSISSSSGSGSLEALSSEYVTITSLKDIYNNKKVGEFWILGEILDIEGEWYFSACKSKGCGKKLQDFTDKMYCKPCNKHWLDGIIKYKVVVVVLDNNQDVHFLLWDNVCSTLLRVTASELKEKYSEIRESLNPYILAINYSVLNGKFELTIKVKPKLNRTQHPYSPPGPGRPFKIKRHVALPQRRLHRLPLLRRQRDGRGLHQVVQLAGAVLGDVERLGVQIREFDTAEAERVAGFVEARVGSGVVVLGGDHDGDLHGQDPRHVVVDAFQTRALHAHLRHLGAENQVAHEHREAGDDHGYDWCPETDNIRRKVKKLGRG
nr:replication protein A 70 kDa DNA-binding subunit B-like [Ipomoea batatas]